MTIGLDYTPVVETVSGIQSFPDYVLIEAEALSGARSVRSVIVPYIDPVTGITAPYGRALFHEVGPRAIYQNYGPRVPKYLVDAVSKIEGSLTLDRQSTLLIKDENQGAEISSVDGFIRIFDSSVYTSGIRAITKLRLPLELILAKFGKSTSVVDQARTDGLAVFEVGKYFMNPMLSGTQMRIVRNHMMRWMIRFLETRGTAELEKSIYFAHVASRAHLIAYRRGFRFKPVPKEQTTRLDPDEQILQICGTEFLAVLKARLQE